MALTVVYLKKGEEPPTGKKTVVIDCGPRVKIPTIEDTPKRMTLRINVADFEETLSDLSDKGVTRVFVRGYPAC